VGLLFPGMPAPADGMIAVVETQLPGMADHICLPVSHMQMLVDPGTMTQACAFFATGRFHHPSASSPVAQDAKLIARHRTLKFRQEASHGWT
jgi:hypothetical protein